MVLASNARPSRVPRSRTACFLALLAMVGLSYGCAGPHLVHVGYAAPNKVWYHWQTPNGGHLIIVCDVEPDGGETNCRETEI
jgi:hypothetical protein